MKKYSTGTVSELIRRAQELGYYVVTVQEGVLGHGHVFLMAPKNYSGNFEIREVPLNEWSSAHTIRRFTKVSSRIAALLAAEGWCW